MIVEDAGRVRNLRFTNDDLRVQQQTVISHFFADFRCEKTAARRSDTEVRNCHERTASRIAIKGKVSMRSRDRESSLAVQNLDQSSRVKAGKGASVNLRFTMYDLRGRLEGWSCSVAASRTTFK
jgi:hypothetical protein